MCIYISCILMYLIVYNFNLNFLKIVGYKQNISETENRIQYKKLGIRNNYSFFRWVIFNIPTRFLYIFIS